MDNGNKIRINRPEVKLFLQGDLLPANIQSPVKYNLAEEYAKTRSKKISFAIIVLMICVVAVTAITVGLVRFLQERNEALQVNIEVFNDLNLKNLLDVVTRTQNSLDQASQQKNLLELELATKISQEALQRDTDIQLLNSLDMEEGERSRERDRIIQNYESAVASINSEYIPQIELLEGQMQDFTNQLASFDSTNVELAQQQEAAINSQRQAFELEKQELIANYDTLVADLMLEIEYLQNMQLETQAQSLTVLTEQHDAEMNLFDPVFIDERANAIVEQYSFLQTTEGESSDTSSVNDYVFMITDEGLQSSVENMLLNIEKEYADFNYVAGVASSVPWENSLNNYMKSLTNMANKIGDDIVSSSIDIFLLQEASLQDARLELAQERLDAETTQIQLADLQAKFDALQAEFATVQEKLLGYETRVLNYEEIILGYEKKVLDYEEIVFALDVRARQSGDAGYILNIADKDSIRVYISPLFEQAVQEGTRAFVFREGNLVGMVSLRKRGNLFYAEPDEGVADLLRVNDVLLLELIEQE